jgi:phosphate/sulfate permease
MRALRSQDVLFAIVSLVVLALAVFRLQIAIPALLGALLCGAIYLIAGMLPRREQPFFERVSTSLFLSAVLSSLILILPTTLGAPMAEWHAIVLALAAAPPAAALILEIARTPRLIRSLLRFLGWR